MNVVYTGMFKKDFKRMIKRNKDEKKLWDIINKLLKGKPLPGKYEDHPL